MQPVLIGWEFMISVAAVEINDGQTAWKKRGYIICGLPRAWLFMNQ
jgi:hypothetical protein